MTRTLLLILAALTLMLGSFIWFVITWDADARPPMTFILEENRNPAPATRTAPSIPRAHGTAGGAMAQPSAVPTETPT